MMWWKKTDLLINRNKGGNAMHVLANRTTGGDISQLCNDINEFFHSVSSHLDPLPAPPATTELQNEMSQTNILLASQKLNTY